MNSNKKLPLTAWLRRSLVASAFAALAAALWTQREPLAAAFAGASLPPLAVAALVLLVYRPVNAAVWSPVLASLGARLPALRAARVWMVTEALRWVPGGIWGFASRVAEARRAGVPASKASLSLPVELALTVLAWGGTALFGLALSGQLAAFADLLPAGAAAPPTLLLAAAACGAFALLLLSRAPRLRRIIAGVRPAPALAALAAYLLLCTFHGLAFHLVLVAIAGDAAPGLWAAVGSNSAAWLVGFFAIGIPGGIGVREAGAAFFLAPVMGVPEAAAAAILWRGLQIGGELLWLAICHLPAATTAPPPPGTSPVSAPDQPPSRLPLTTTP